MNFFFEIGIREGAERPKLPLPTRIKKRKEANSPYIALLFVMRKGEVRPLATHGGWMRAISPPPLNPFLFELREGVRQELPPPRREDGKPSSVSPGTTSPFLGKREVLLPPTLLFFPLEVNPRTLFFPPAIPSFINRWMEIEGRLLFPFFRVRKSFLSNETILLF